jgi:two-component system OmpR family response regulator
VSSVTKTIAIVEDDPRQRAHYADALRGQGYQVDEYGGREEAQRAFEQALPDLAILDIMLEQDIGGGFEICRYLQRRDAQLPVIFLTSRGNEVDKIYGLQLGAWDYQTKPVTFDYLIERVRSLFRIKAQQGATPQATDLMAVGKLRLNRAAMQASWNDCAVALTPTEFDLLNVLLEKADGASYQDLANATRQGVVENNTINTHIVHLRKKFRRVDATFDCIKTKYGYGYHWICR